VQIDHCAAAADSPPTASRCRCCRLMADRTLRRLRLSEETVYNGIGREMTRVVGVRARRARAHRRKACRAWRHREGITNGQERFFYWAHLKREPTWGPPYQEVLYKWMSIGPMGLAIEWRANCPSDRVVALTGLPKTAVMSSFLVRDPAGQVFRPRRPTFEASRSHRR
jgi:hypothetical protein